jgi:hypothetical protein
MTETHSDLPDDPRDLEEDRVLVHGETGEAYRVVGFEEESGLPEIRREEDLDADFSGTVGKIFTESEAHRYFRDEAPSEIDDGEVIVTINESAWPARIDQVLQRLTRGWFGYSIEPEDTRTVTVGASELQDISEGDRVTVRRDSDGVHISEKGEPDT